VLAAQPRAVAEARRKVTALPLPLKAREQLALLVSELVANAVIHPSATASGSVALDIEIRRGHARIEVHDGGEGFDPPPSLGSDPLTARGQGLRIIAALSDTWGVRRAPDGCTVWCEVDLPQPEPAASVEHEFAGAYPRGAQL
jgi:anti-sigma regulatory factor (Ser/Thr protein kinase)